MRFGRRILAAALLAIGASTVAAQPVYRCGTAGSTTYSQTPCADGRAVDAADPRTASQRADAQRTAARDKSLADTLERQRRTDEAGRPVATTAGSFKARPDVTATPEPVVRHPRHHRRRAAAR